MSRICINWNPHFQTQIYLAKVPLNVNIVKQDLLHKNSFWNFNWCWFWSSQVCTLMLWWYLSPARHFYSDWLWPYCADSQNVRFLTFYCLGLVWSVNFTNFLVKFLADFLKFDLTVRVGGGRGFNKGGWVWHAHGVHATPMGYVLEGRRLLLPWVNKRFTVVEDR